MSTTYNVITLPVRQLVEAKTEVEDLTYKDALAWVLDYAPELVPLDAPAVAALSRYHPTQAWRIPAGYAVSEPYFIAIQEA